MADYEGEFTAGIQGDLTYFDGGSNLVVVLNADSIDLLCSGTDPFPCMDSNNNIIPYSGGSSPIPRPLTDFNLSDLVGTGDVKNLAIGVAMFGTSFPASDGLDALNVFGEADVFDATVEVTYEFTPIPVPAAVWLFGYALGLLGWMRRKAI